MAQHRRALERLLYAVQHDKGATLLLEEVGCGKTTLTRAFILQLKEDKYDAGVVTNPSLPARDFLEEIDQQLGASASGTKVDLLRGLNGHLMRNRERGKVTVRIAIRCTLNPLSAEGSIQCVAFRLKNAGDTRGIFTEEAVRLIYQYTRGIPRSVNNLCDLCLLEGYTASAWTVDAAPVRRVAQERR